MHRDRVLDKVCKRITGGKSDVLVAFGDASSCHTGFGYAPAPQGRLRKRLTSIHGAKLTLIDEYNTSQYCHKCHHKVLPATVSHSLEKIQQSAVLKRKLDRNHFRIIRPEKYQERPHGLRYCSYCKNEHGSPTFHHRDLNSARNILCIYLSLASTGSRPQVFQRINECGVPASLMRHQTTS